MAEKEIVARSTAVVIRGAKGQVWTEKNLMQDLWLTWKWLARQLRGNRKVRNAKSRGTERWVQGMNREIVSARRAKDGRRA